MVDAFTTTSAMSNLVQTAYDRMVEFALRAQPTFRAVADKRPAQLAMPGSSVVFELYQDLAAQTATLTENVDPDAVAMSNTNTVTVTLNEYGAAVLKAKKLQLLSLSDVDPAIANVVAFNMLDSVDSVVQTVLRGTANIVRESGGSLSTTNAITTITSTDTFKSRDVRFTVAKLRANKVQPKKGDLFWSAIHPEVSHDLRAETGVGSWRQPHEYSANSAIWAGEIGQYEGAFFVETPRCYNAVDGGTGGNTVRVFRTYVAGQQALAEATAEDFHTVINPIPQDKLMRFYALGWYGVAGWSLYRTQSLYQIQTTSSIDGS